MSVPFSFQGKEEGLWALWESRVLCEISKSRVGAFLASTGTTAIPLQQLGVRDVQRLVDAKAETLAPKTVSYMRAVLRAALNQAVRWEVIPRNPALGVTMPRAPRYAYMVFTPEQAKVFLEAPALHPLGPLFSTAMAVGLRLGEALGLQWADIDCESKTLSVRRALQRFGGSLHFVEPKSDKSRRTVSLPECLVAILKAHKKTQAEQRMAVGPRWQDKGLVFASPIGSPLDDSYVRKQFRSILKGALVRCLACEPRLYAEHSRDIARLAFEVCTDHERRGGRRRRSLQ